MRRTEQHREFRRCLHEARGPIKLSSRAVEENVVPHARASRKARNPPQRPLQLDHDHDRQTRPVSLGQQVGCDDRLISLRRPVVGDKKMLVCNVAQRSGEPASRGCSTGGEPAAQAYLLPNACAESRAAPWRDPPNRTPNHGHNMGVAPLRRQPTGSCTRAPVVRSRHDEQVRSAAVRYPSRDKSKTHPCGLTGEATDTEKLMSGGGVCRKIPNARRC